MASPKVSRTPQEDKPAKKAPGVEKLLRPGLTQLAPSLEQVTYRGAVPLKSFAGWVALVVISAAVVGGLAAHILVQNRTEQLVEETSSRVAMQAQGRAGVVAEWVNGLAHLADSIANAEMVRLYVAESPAAAQPESNQPIVSQAAAVVAQKPYIEQWLKEFTSKNKLAGAYLVNLEGKILLGTGDKPDVLANTGQLAALVRQGLPDVQPLSQTAGKVAMDMLRPIRAMAVNDESGDPVGALLVRIPVGDKIAELLAATPLDQDGERTVLVQEMDGKAEIVGRTALAPLAAGSLKALEESLQNGTRVRLQHSPLDGVGVFATLKPVMGTPLAVLQEYVSTKALGLVSLYKPGIYAIVTLLVVVLGALMLALSLHFMGQRNRTRVKMLGQTMDALVRVVESRDPYLSGHHAKVSRLAVAVSNMLNMSVAERATLFYASQMAAVGRLMVPRTVLSKQGKLSTAERKDLESHINQAVVVLGDLDFDLPIVPVITQMYERVDGSGHPQGLKAADISPMAKVLGACDAYVALTSERAHRKALTKAEALKAMDTGAFDAQIVSVIKSIAK